MSPKYYHYCKTTSSDKAFYYDFGNFSRFSLGFIFQTDEKQLLCNKYFL